MNDRWKEALGLQAHPQGSPVAAGHAFEDGLGGSLQEQAQEHTGDSVASRHFFTNRDADTLEAILESTDEPGHGTTVSNRLLGKLLGISPGAAAARVKRLVEMGLIQVAYDASIETGRVNRRTIWVYKVPTRPWTHDDD